MNRPHALIAAVALGGLVACGGEGEVATADPELSARASTSVFQAASRKCGVENALDAKKTALATGELTSHDLLCFIQESGGDAEAKRRMQTDGEGQAHWPGVNIRWMRSGERAQFVAADQAAGAVLPELKTTLAAPTTPSFQDAQRELDRRAQARESAAASDTAVPLEHRNALEKARDYLDYTSFSDKSLRRQLDHEGYPPAAIDYAMKSINVDWDEQALRKAKEYLNYTSFSKSGLRSQLEHEGFTRAQIDSASESIDW